MGCITDPIVVASAGQLHAKDEVQIVVRLRLSGEDVRRSASIEPNVAHAHSCAPRRSIGLQLAAHNRYQVAQPHFQRRKVTAPMDAHHLVHDVVEATHLLVAQHSLLLAAQHSLLLAAQRRLALVDFRFGVG